MCVCVTWYKTWFYKTWLIELDGFPKKRSGRGLTRGMELIGTQGIKSPHGNPILGC